MTPLFGEKAGQADNDGAEGGKLPAGGGAEIKEEQTEPKNGSVGELPTDVRVKLRKLGKLESRYQGTIYAAREHRKLPLNS